jgi:hypothetical protein
VYRAGDMTSIVDDSFGGTAQDDTPLRVVLRRFYRLTTDPIVRAWLPSSLPVFASPACGPDMTLWRRSRSN